MPPHLVTDHQVLLLLNFRSFCLHLLTLGLDPWVKVKFWSSCCIQALCWVHCYFRWRFVVSNGHTYRVNPNYKAWYSLCQCKRIQLSIWPHQVPNTIRWPKIQTSNNYRKCSWSLPPWWWWNYIGLYSLDVKSLIWRLLLVLTQEVNIFVWFC